MIAAAAVMDQEKNYGPGKHQKQLKIAPGFQSRASIRFLIILILDPEVEV
jgi:hypothetical protein